MNRKTAERRRRGLLRKPGLCRRGLLLVGVLLSLPARSSVGLQSRLLAAHLTALEVTAGGLREGLAEPAELVGTTLRLGEKGVPCPRHRGPAAPSPRLPLSWALPNFQPSSSHPCERISWLGHLLDSSGEDLVMRK
ncbi:hypothetical protein MC885_011671 [Smutsia gigantea]|nr:hypothetical protein MC885_011671 [Smutsia gigantea]